MGKHCETFEHTADVGLTAWGDTLGELMEALAEELADFICPREQVRPAERRTILVAAEDVEALTLDFLSQIMFTIQTRRFLVAAVEVARADEASVEAQLVGEPLDPHRHEFHTEVKAVTYHQLHVAREEERWVARVILDI